jgi:hypothetical protein
MWEKVVVAYFKVLFQHLFEGTEENRVSPRGSQSLGSDLNDGHPEYNHSGMMFSPKHQCVICSTYLIC